ncbi:MAG: hypothetical protein QOJ39_3135 [Candidatus Eremiobacteraeota bacterium]|jgi:hypothetical protein|nr:hypothetical protein [Candidatus Eremiobacteraeota bacterium]
MTDAKVVRFAAVLVVLAGYAFVFRSGEARVNAGIAANANVAEALRDGERTLQSREAFVRERGRLRERLHHADFALDRSALVARFVRDAAAIAVRHGCAITGMTASGATPLTATGPTPLTGDDVFEDITVEMAVEGRYAGVLATIRALSAGRVLASVDVTSVARKNAASADATLIASLRVVLERIAPVPVKVGPNA